MNENDLMDSLPTDAEEAFPIYEAYLRETFLDSNWNNGGPSADAKKDYICRVIASMQIYNMDVGIPSEIPHDYDDFESFFSQADKKITILSTKLKLANAQKKKQNIVPYYTLEPAKKTEIHHHISQIRTLIESSELSASKRDTLFNRLAALSLEVDKDRTRTETYMGIFTILAGGTGEIMKKALPHIEAIAKVFSKSIESPPVQITFIAKQVIEAPRKQIPAPSKIDDMADDIPF